MNHVDMCLYTPTSLHQLQCTVHKALYQCYKNTVLQEYMAANDEAAHKLVQTQVHMCGIICKLLTQL